MLKEPPLQSPGWRRVVAGNCTPSGTQSTPWPKLAGSCVRTLPSPHSSPKRWGTAQNLAVHWGPRSDTMLWGRPCRLKTCYTKSSAVSLADGSFGKGMKCAILEKHLTILRRAAFPPEGGRTVTKLTEMWDLGHLGTGRGCNQLVAGFLDDLA